MTKYHNKLLVGFVASDTGRVIYLKQNSEDGEFAVKTKERGLYGRVLLASDSLSTVLREFAETIAQHTNGFTTWRQL